ncbi:sigma-70 family RNA polymerase sigma factor [Camelliibacillus cellulosilyticus]|uniref:Sigma-70 family RNA polymerase sigma factor n=1 Tax=Camelliibacillus cellulosilyticus TaxID=2174486 RepID=A0ABV9GN59_9BACL
MEPRVAMTLDQEEMVEKLIEHYGRALMNFAFTYLKDWAQAEDAVQEVLIKWYQKGSALREPAALKQWLYRTTANQCKDMLRKTGRGFSLIERLKFHHDQPVMETPESFLVNRDMQLGVVQKVLTLPIKYREVTILFYYEELTTNDIAALLKINRSTVKTRLSRARELLKGKLEGGGRDE